MEEKLNNDLEHSGTKGMKWGVRRYQNEDGTLTEAGKKRYAKDTASLSDKEKKRYVTDANKWVSQDIDRTEKVVSKTADLSRDLKKFPENSIKNHKKKRVNLDEMSDKEMREKINRELMERQYNDLFTEDKSLKGKQRAAAVLEGVGAVLTVGATALSIALAIRELSGKGKG